MIPLRWRTVLLLAGVAALNYADRTSLAAVFPLLRTDLNMDDLQLAGIGTLFLWTYAFGSLGAGMVADRWPRNRVIAFSLLGWSAVTILTGFARSAEQLLATRVLLGLTECFYLPAAISLIADHHEAGSRGRAMALHVCGLNIGLIGGGTLAGYLGQHYGWRSGPLLLGALGILFSFVCFALLEESPNRKQSAPPMLSIQWTRLLGNRRFLLLSLEAMLISVGTWMFFNWMPLYFQERFGLSLALAGFSGTALLQLSTVLGVVIGGDISDRVAANGITARLKMMTYCYLACAPCLLVFPGGLGFAAVGSGVMLFSFLKAMAMANEPPALCEMVHDRDRGTAQSVMNTLNTLAGGAGVFIAGYLKADWGLSGIFSAVGILVCCSAALTWKVRTIRATAVP